MCSFEFKIIITILVLGASRGGQSSLLFLCCLAFSRTRARLRAALSLPAGRPANHNKNQRLERPSSGEIGVGRPCRAHSRPPGSILFDLQRRFFLLSVRLFSGLASKQRPGLFCAGGAQGAACLLLLCRRRRRRNFQTLERRPKICLRFYGRRRRRHETSAAGQPSTSCGLGPARWMHNQLIIATK